MKKVISVVSLMLALFSLVSCSSAGLGADAGEYTKMTAEQAKARIDSGDAILVVDVRTAEEYAAERIAGAILIPNETIEGERPALLPDLDAEILIYCRSGNRSAQAAGKLADMGYTKVFDFGGIIDWPYETVAGAAEIP